MNSDREMRECEYGEKISAAYDGELSEEECRKLEKHARECPFCNRELRQLRALSCLLGEIEMPSISSDFLTNLHNSVPRMNSHLVMLRTARRLSAIAATILVGCVAWLWLTDAVANGGEAVPAQWERIVIAQTSGEISEVTQEEVLAEWIVEDLAGEGNSD